MVKRAGLAVAFIFWIQAAVAANCVFLGDSLMAPRTSPQTVTATQTFPYLISQRRGCTEINKGVAGDTTTGMKNRFAADIEASNPDLLVIMSENDAWGPYGISLATSEANWRWMIERAQTLSIPLVIMTPPIIIDPGNNLDVTAQIADSADYIQLQRALAQEYGVPAIDVHAHTAEKLYRDPVDTADDYMDPWHRTVQGNAGIDAIAALPQYAYVFAGLEPSGWETVAGPITTSGESYNWYGYGVCQFIDMEQIANISGTTIRITFKAGTSKGLKISTAYVGHAPDSGNDYSYDAAPTALSFPSGATATANGSFSGEATFTINLAKRGLVICFDFVESANDAGAKVASGQTGWQGYYKGSNPDISQQTKSGWSNGNAVDMVTGIQVD